MSWSPGGQARYSLSIDGRVELGLLCIGDRWLILVDISSLQEKANRVNGPRQKLEFLTRIVILYTLVSELDTAQ